MLKITDIAKDTAMSREEMAGVTGGTSLSALLDFSTSLTNKVADVNQTFAFGLQQGNTGAVTNNQGIIGGNGIVYAPVKQSQHQDNYMDVYDIGNVSVS